MNDFSEQIAYAELSLEDAKKIVSFGESIKRLEKNRDFQKVVLDGYFNEEVRRLVFLTAEPALDEKSLQETWSDVRSIAGFRKYLFNQKGFAELAEKEVRDHMQTVEELREAEAAGESEA